MFSITTLLICLVAFAVGVIILKLVCKLFKFSAKIVIRLVFNAIVGALILIVFNFAGGFLGLSLELSPFNALFVGIFGIPGVIFLLILG